MSNHAAGSSTPIPPPVTDIYRPTTAASQRELAPFLPPGTTPTTRPSLPEIFGIDEKTFSSRVGGKNILIDPSPTAGGSGAGVGGETKGLSDLVVGKKRHKGHPQELVKARRAAEYAQAQRDSVGAKGLRAVRRKLKRKERGGVVDKGIIEGITYQSLLPLHHLHLAYLAAMLNLTPRPAPSSTATSTPDTPQAPRQPVASSSTHPDPQLPLGLGAESIQSKILKADLTGSILSVLSSRNPSPIGIRGIVIEETASTFRLISRDNTIRVIPKNGTQFRISFPAYAPPPLSEAEQAQIAQGEPEPPIDWEKHRKTCPRIELEILGTAFGYRSADRAGRKFRPAQGGGGGSGWGEDWVQGEWSGVLGEVEGELARRAGESGRRVDSNGGRKGKGKGRKAGSGAGASESGHDARGEKKRKRGKSRRKDLPAWGRLDVP